MLPAKASQDLSQPVCLLFLFSSAFMPLVRAGAR
jgi:hypothetical protein